jgi:hypothetical protein
MYVCSVVLTSCSRFAAIVVASGRKKKSIYNMGTILLAVTIIISNFPDHLFKDIVDWNINLNSCKYFEMLK